MIETIDRVADLRVQVRTWKAAGRTVALVPTMGNLHQGHVDLVKRARGEADEVVVSIFVNPTQFGPSEDFARYPRTLEQDQAKVEAAGASLVFAPQVVEIYPRGADRATRVEVPGLSNVLCGAVRPGHFAGVAQIVAKLFNMVQPDVAVFGEKDRQQLLVIQAMTEDLNIPVRIVGQPTIRDPDGLAMSSRNAYLTDEERSIAPALYTILCAAVAQIQAGVDDFAAIEDAAKDTLADAGFKPDYVRILRADDLGPPAAGDRLAVFAAAWLGRARLIDNVVVG